MTERYAIYYAPETTDPLWRGACRWLGRDAATGEPVNGVTGMAPARRLALTRSARRYGFHATLKPPMALAAGQNFTMLADALAGFARERRPVPLGPLALRELGGFLALVPERQDGALTALAADCVTAFEPFRAPLDGELKQRRLAESHLTPRQKALLETYGYPFVLDEFRFHMTVTDRLEEADRAEVRIAASDWFEPYIGSSLMVDRLVIFRESEPGAPFERLEDFPLAGVD